MSNLKYFHCKKCLTELQSGKAGDESPESYSQYTAFIDDDGYITVACKRHKMVIIRLPLDINDKLVSDIMGSAPCDCPDCLKRNTDPNLN